MRTWKRILACILAVAMLASFGFAGAADEEVEGEPNTISETEGDPVEDAAEAETTDAAEAEETEAEEATDAAEAEETEETEAVACTELEVGGKTEHGIYTVTRLENDIWHIEDCTAANPAGLQLDAEGNFVGWNNVSDMYVVLGTEKALLVDLSNPHEDGIEDIVAIFDELAGELEQEIFITHAHSDHTGMYMAFKDTDIPVYITSEDFDNLTVGSYACFEKAEDAEKIQTVTIGEDTFDLGGREFKLVAVPGHTDGSNVLYEVENKIGFSGDALGSGNGIWLFGNLVEYQKGLKNLLKVIEDELDGEITLYTGHAFQAADMFTGAVTPTNAQYVEDMLTLVQNIETGGEYTIAQYTSDMSGYLNTVVSYGTAQIDLPLTELAKSAKKSATGLKVFEDIEDAALTKAVTNLIAAGITNGTSFTTFEPEKTLDRAEFMTMLGRAVGAVVDQDADTGFTDVVNDGWSQGYIAWGVENGLIEGYGDGTFGQYDTLTKEHVNIIATRFNDKFGAQLTLVPFSSNEGDATRAEVVSVINGVAWVGGLANADLFGKLLLPKTPAKDLDPSEYKAWGAFPEDDDFVQGVGGSSNPNMDTAIELYEKLTYTNKDEDADELTKEITYYVYDPVKAGADAEKKYPVLVWFHGAGNGMDGDSVVAEAGALLFATEEYQELMGTPCYVIVPVANESKNAYGGNEGTWMTKPEDGTTSIYSQVINDLITDFMTENADNVSTLHINGTSAGGYMAWRYTIDYADTITSTFLMAPAYTPSEEDLETVKNVTMAQVHGLHDELVNYERTVGPVEDALNAAENFTLIPFEWVRNRDGAVFSLYVGMEMGQHCICNQVAENLMFADGTPMNENLPNGVTGWYKTVFEGASTEAEAE